MDLCPLNLGMISAYYYIQYNTIGKCDFVNVIIPGFALGGAFVSIKLILIFEFDEAIF